MVSVMRTMGRAIGRSEQEAQAIMAGLQARLAECHLEMHSTKTKIVYCKDGSRKGSHAQTPGLRLSWDMAFGHGW